MECVPGTRPPSVGASPLELGPSPGERPRTVAAPVLEGTTLRARRILGAPEVGFAAFLDGVQHSRPVYLDSGIPLVYGTVAAAVRARRNRRMVTWRQPVVERALYVPRRFAPPSLWAAAPAGLRLVDTTAELTDPAEAAHPFALLEMAMSAVQRERERLEQELAEAWCRLEHAPLFIDGGISDRYAVATASCAVGVIKSHRTLYAAPESLPIVFGLRRGERTSVFRVRSARPSSPQRTPVASWYLRLRDAAGHDPTWGLVRVEVADMAAADPAAISARADRVSRWVLAETAPLALPDARWDKLAYGVRDCEEFLAAIC
jgi:hypothetical protein